MFFTPLLYSIQTRFLRRSRLGIIVWATEYLIPVLLAIIIINYDLVNFIIAFWVIIASYNLYEIGYIQNDCETIKHENTPTKRLTNEDLVFYEKNKIFIYVVRIIIETLLSYYLYSKGVSLYNILILWLIIPYYMLYNKLRGRINLYLILPLTSWRYCFPVLLYGCLIDSTILWAVIICLFVAYPFPTFIEICSDGKGCPPEKWTRIFLKNFNERFTFRIKYYTLMCIVYLVLAIYYVVPYCILLIPFYYLMDRIPQLWMKKMEKK